jgi:hypothetical protein
MGEGILRTGEKAEKASGINLSAVDWKGCYGVLNLNAGIGAGKLIGELNLVEGFDVGIALSTCVERK